MPPHPAFSTFRRRFPAQTMRSSMTPDSRIFIPTIPASIAVLTATSHGQAHAVQPHQLPDGAAITFQKRAMHAATRAGLVSIPASAVR